MVYWRQEMALMFCKREFSQSSLHSPGIGASPWLPGCREVFLGGDFAAGSGCCLACHSAALLLLPH